MSRPITQSILQKFGRPAYLVPVTITDLDPLTVEMFGETMPAVTAPSFAGDLELGPANALYTSPGTPYVLPLPIG